MYLVCYDDWRQNENYFFNQLENAKKKFKEFKEDLFKDPEDYTEETEENKITIQDNYGQKIYMYKIETED